MVYKEYQNYYLPKFNTIHTKQSCSCIDYIEQTLITKKKVKTTEDKLHRPYLAFSNSSKEDNSSPLPANKVFVSPKTACASG